MSFECSDDKNKKWVGHIVYLKNWGNYHEMIIESRSRLHVVFGKTSQGGFACIPDFWVGCHLVDLQDTFWNTEKLINVLGVVDGITVATAFDLLKEEINF
mgnify:CR=1 FL=1